MDRRHFLRRLATAAEPAALAPPSPRPRTSAGLEPYVGPWDERRAAHLVRRTHFGLTRADLVDALLRGSAGAAVDALVDAAIARPLPDAPPWATGPLNDGQNIPRQYEWQEAWYAEMHAGGLRERMTLLWHDHLATEVRVYEHARFAYDYLTLLRRNALGSFRTLLHDVGLTPAMLIYLDGQLNEVGAPNENYARELYELFSLGLTGADGQPNYTQGDIAETARALTGWVISQTTLRAQFVASRHDAGQKTIFGQTGAWGYEDVLTVLFGQRAASIAHFVAGKLYAWFVHPVPDPTVRAELAGVLLANSFQIAPAVRTLLKSAHFYDEAFAGARLKAPAEVMVGALREMGVGLSNNLLAHTRESGVSLGQDVLNPPNVAGWPGYAPDQYRAWVTTGSLPERRGFADRALAGAGPFPAYDPLPLVEQLSDPTSARAVVRDLSGHLLPVALDEDAFEEALALLLDGAPEFEWVEIYVAAPDAARGRVRALMSHLVNLPEYQLT